MHWHITYGAYYADGERYAYLVTKDRTGWVALYHPSTEPRRGPYGLLPFGHVGTRRAAQRLAENFERDIRCSR